MENQTEPQEQPRGLAFIRQMVENKKRLQEDGRKNFRTTTNLHEMLDEDERFIEFEKQQEINRNK